MVLAYTAASARVQLPAIAAGMQLELQNDGTGTAWIALGNDNTVTAVIPVSLASGPSYPVLGGRSKVISVGSATWLAAIGTGTGNIYATWGAGG
jgi:hypothetical protein